MSYKAARRFSLKQKTRAVFFMLLILGGIQLYFYLNKSSVPTDFVYYDQALQAQLDSLKAQGKSTKIFPFNPNFLTDKRGYFLHMSVDEIDRLHHYRDQNRWIRSAREFQQVTKVSDAWLSKYSPYFTFPKPEKSPQKSAKKAVKPIFELNQVTAKELVTIRGIGKVLSERIIKYRKRIQGFSKLNQLDEVYGLKPVVLERMKRQLTISSPPQIQKIALDRASLAELVKLPYLNQNEAKKIISLRTSQGSIRLLDLERIEGFDALKIKRLTLYLF